VQPYIFAAATNVHVAYSTTRSAQEAGHNLADIYVVSSTNGGSSFNAPERAATSVVEPDEDSPLVIYFAPAAVLQVGAAPQIRRWAFASQLASRVWGFYSPLGGGEWTPVQIVSPSDPNACEESLDTLEEPEAACPGAGFLAQRPDATVQGQQVDLVWQAVGTDERWDVFQSETTDFDLPEAWSVPEDMPDGVTSHLPSVTLKGNTLNVLWADNADPEWKVRGSLASGAVSGENAFLPDAAAKDGLTIYATYSRLTTPGTTNYDIYWNRSADGGLSWPLETQLPVASPDPSLYPSVTYDQQGQHTWVVWREGNGPNWTLKGQQIVEP
jgi:hypothetical protein